MSSFEKNLDKNPANFVPLTPLTFLERAKDIYPNYEALVYEDRKYTWLDIYKRCTQFASALEKIGIAKGCLLYTSPSPRDSCASRMPSSA